MTNRVKLLLLWIDNVGTTDGYGRVAYRLDGCRNG